ncbi:bifunctional RecB family nuclease/DEAD/DEAH box helicase [Nocardia wallacei]|uniref:bifunctional RecB family nuclease/DEAD/DEAH box helicase n=1 Tax=Nocardia wallacei TaxID=480035 RepID=UPI0024543864|nr:bifunctional RecB family nuclease/DEAD/DEAH box helicase [Nocardia wallacei]
MILVGDRVVYSTGDLVAAARCEFAVLRALDAELGLVAPVGSGAGAVPTEHGEIDLPGPDFVRIAPPASATTADLARAHRDTLSAVHRGVAAIAGATFFDGTFAASCAALVRTEVTDRSPIRESAAGDDGPELPSEWSGSAAIDHGGQGQVVDGDALSCSFATADTPDVPAVGVPSPGGHDTATGDAETAPTTEPPCYIVYGSARAEASTAQFIELAACAEAMRHSGFRVDPVLRVRHSDGSESTRPLAEAIRVYAARRRRLAAILAAKQDELLPVQWGDRRYLACGRCATCTAELVTGRDLLLVAGMRPAVRAQLRDAGITTVDRLVRADAAVTRVATQTFSALRRQAEAQVRRERTGAPVHTLIDAAALAALPSPSPGDVFLTVAGSPAAVVGVGVLPTRPPEEGADPADPAILFHAFGLHDDPAALLEFLAERQENHPDLRIYHYRSAARPLLAELCARCGADEVVADDLLGALVDLYPIVRAALVIGERSYELRDLAGLLGTEAPATDLESECAQIPRLRDRLRDLAADNDIRACPAPRDTPAESPAAVEDALREFAFDDRGAGERTDPAAPDETQAASGDAAPGWDGTRTPAQRSAALMAAALGYRRRERQPLHWAHTDRLHRPVAEWADTPGVLVADWGTVDTKWHSTGHGPMRRYLKLTGRLGTGSAPPPGTPVLTLYDRPVPGMRCVPGRRATARATVLGCALDDNFDDTVRVEELLPEGCALYDDLPVAIVPGPPEHDENIEAALESAAHDLLVSLPEVPATAAFDLLCRRAPRLRSADALPEVFGDHAAAVTAAVLDLDDSYVAVQGPSGTGKTDTAARVIERLVTRYRWRVGVVAQSHWAVEEVLDALVRVGVLPELVAKSDARAVAPEWLAIDPARFPRFLDNAVNGCVVGGLPDELADAERVAPGSLDLLMVADAGHFPVADAVAVAGSARNLLLLGDPAPLPGHGTHPEPVHDSVLGRLVGDNPTLPPEFGYFLDRTWRMHPRLCEPVSRLRYGNRLRSTETVTLARDLEGVPPGVRSVPVDHHGNGTESAEEAREVVRRVRALLGLPWRQGAVTRRLHPHDILVVTPYHAQAARIRTLLSRARIEDVLVGTAERFAGREAAVVLVSLTTSSPAEAPHGIDTLLSRHWLTTVVSRAMWTALVIHSPLLTEYLPETPEQLSDLAAFLELVSP